jgi:DNA modification methylase
MKNFTAKDIVEFIKKYGKPYNPETDNYGVTPFQENIDNASKSSKIYNMHMYWTKQDPYVVKRYIEHYTKPGDIVLDAFAGTGMTGVAAMMSGRYAVLCEISPACIHIARNYTTPIDPHILQKTYSELQEKIEPEIKPLYRTTCHNCKNKNAQIANTILSDIFKCPRCGTDILFAGGGRWQMMKKSEKFDKIKCDNCRYEFSKAKTDFVRSEPIEIRVDCNKCRVKGEKKAKPLDEDDWTLYIQIHGGPTKVVHEGDDEWTGHRFLPVERFVDELGTKVYHRMVKKNKKDFITAKEPPYWYPKDVKFFGDEPRRNLKRGITHPYQIFSQRNLIALSILWHYINEIEEGKIKEKFRLLFTSIIYRVNLQYKWNLSEKGGMRMGTLYIPSLIKDMNVRFTFNDKSKDLFEAAREINLLKESEVLVLNNDACNLSSLPVNSLDYAYYDPPYGANINYSELNIMWEAWLGEFTDIEKEIIENEYQNKSRETYEEMMITAIKESYRVLKPARILTMVYSYTDETMYRTIQRIAHNSGFIDEGEVLHINSIMKTKSQLDSDKTQQRYLVINFKKPQNGEKKIIEKSEDIEFDVIKVVHDFLTKNPGKTRDYIYDQVIKQLFPSTKIEKFNLDEILKNFFRKVGDEWYAPGTLLKRKSVDEKQIDLFEKPKPVHEHPEKEIILQLQDFLKKYGKVPYNELREFYLRKVNISIERDFDELVEENFKIEQGKVRLPTAYEQEKMQDITYQYRKAQVKKFLSKTLTRIPTQQEICDWIKFCYENKLYNEGWQLFNSINENSVSPKTYKEVEKIAEVCKIKSG